MIFASAYCELFDERADHLVSTSLCLTVRLRRGCDWPFVCLQFDIKAGEV